jgi:hypothetical protein
MELLEGFNLVGPESYVRERIAAFAESGVTVLNVNFPWSMSFEEQVAQLELLRSFL